MRSALILVALVSLPTLVRAQTQHIKVAVDIKDTTRQIPSSFAVALRQLGDVDVVTTAEEPDFILSGVAICEPDCDQLTSYAIALRFSSPMSSLSLDVLARRISHQADVRLDATRDSIRSLLGQRLSYLETNFSTWVALWGRTVYEQKVREFTRDLDYRCFDRMRAMDRAIASDDPSAKGKYDAFLASRTWLC